MIVRLRLWRRPAPAGSTATVEAQAAARDGLSWFCRHDFHDWPGWQPPAPGDVCGDCGEVER